MSEKLLFVGICGSLRKDSRNMGLLRCAQKNLPPSVDMEIANILDLPLFSEDREKPESAKKLIELVSTADALLLACAEYNYSVAPALKNALDWLSREPNNAPLEGKAGALMGAGGGMGSSRAQYHLRQTCVYLNIRLLNKPEIFTNAFSESFDPHGEVQDKALQERIKSQMEALAAHTLVLKK